ncbi:MAG: tetratricopeptide repeat protein [Anaerolineaceae bacterium]|nr:tetratricopeptide repeat protein [Anaerolineaceae bacterium]
MGRLLKTTFFLGLLLVMLGSKIIPVYAAENSTKSFHILQQPAFQGGQELLDQGNALYNAGDYPGAIEKYQAAAEKFKEENNPSGQAIAFNNMGMASGKLLQYENAIEFFNFGLNILVEIEDISGQAVLTTNLGDAYFRLSRFPESLEAYQQSYKFRDQLGDERRKGWALTNIGAVYREMNEFKTAIEYYDQALILHQKFGDLNGRATTINNRAVALHDMGELQQAAEGYQEALQLWESLGNTYGVAALHINLGDLYKNFGLFDQSWEHYKNAADMFHIAGNPGEEAVAITGMGAVRQYLNDYSAALEYYEQALALNEESENPVGRGTVLHNIASILDLQGDYPAAIDNYQKALEIDRSVNDALSTASTLSALGLVYKNQGDYASSLSVLEEAYNIILQYDSIELLIAVSNNLSLVEKALGNFDQGIVLLKDVEHLAIEMDNPSALAKILNNLGFIYGAKGEYEQAFSYFEQALELYEKYSDQNGKANVLNNIGGLYQNQSDYENALTSYLEAKDIAETLGTTALTMTTLNNVGMVFLDLGLIEQADEHIQKALSIAQEIADKGSESSSLNNLGLIKTANKDFSAAKEYYLAALDLQVQIGARPGQIHTLNNLGTLLIDQNDYIGGIAHFNSSLQIAEEIGSKKDISIAYTNLAWANLEAGDYESGVKYSQQSLDLWSQLGDRRGEFHTLFNLGMAYEQKGDSQTALETYIKAINVLESIISDLSVDAYQSAFTDQFTEVYLRAIRLLEELGEPEASFELSERARARAFLDSMGDQYPPVMDPADSELLEEEGLLRKEIFAIENSMITTMALPSTQRDEAFTTSLQNDLAEKQKDYQDLLSKIALENSQLSTLITIGTITIPDVQAMLDDQTTLISFLLTDKTSLAYVITNNSFDLINLNNTADSIKSAVENFRGLGLANPNGPTPLSLTTLYDDLIRPLESHINTPVVGLIPHQSLHYLPFSALFDGSNFLGEKFSIFYLPSASSLPFVKQKNNRTIGNPVILGNPTPPDTSLPSLQFAAEEANQIANIFFSEVLLEGNAKESILNTQLAGSGILHLAAHGTYNPEAPMFSRIWLAEDETQDGRLNVYEVYGLELQTVDLVTLSACQSNLGELSSGDELVGLSRAFLYGAPTVVASLWSVDDQATSELMIAFYTHISEGMGKAEALQVAQRDIRNSQEHPEWVHPYYWAAFVLNGDPGKLSNTIDLIDNINQENENSRFPVWLLYIGIGIGILLLGSFAVLIMRKKSKKADHKMNTQSE